MHSTLTPPTKAIVRINTARASLTPMPNIDIIPPSLAECLSHEQQIGVAAAITSMDDCGGFLLADGTGVGKTRQILAVAEYYADLGYAVLIITKSEVIKPNWGKGLITGSFQHDADSMGINLTLVKTPPLTRGRVQISTYENLGKLKTGVDKNTVLLFDEAHSLKNPDSKRTEHGMVMLRSCSKALFATATPADKGIHVAYLRKAGIGGGVPLVNLYEQLGLYQRAIEAPNGRTIYVWAVRNEEYTRQRMAMLFDEMTEKGRMIKREISLEGVNFEFTSIETPIDVRRMLYNIYLQYNDPDNYEFAKGLDVAHMLMHQRRQLEPYKIDTVVNMALKARSDGYQVVIFASRVNHSAVKDRYDDEAVVWESEGTLKTLKQRLMQAGLADTDIAEIHGGVSKKVSLQGMAEFQDGKASIVIATVESGGTGINLDDRTGDRPRKIIIMTPPFSAVENVQAIGRGWRLTTKSYPTISYVFSQTSVDVWNRQIISQKIQALGAAVQGETMRMDIPVGIAEDTVERFIEMRREAEWLSAIELKRRYPDVLEDFTPNRYAGWYKGKKIAVGEGLMRRVADKWQCFPALFVWEQEVLSHRFSEEDAQDLRMLSAYLDMEMEGDED